MRQQYLLKGIALRMNQVKAELLIRFGMLRVRFLRLNPKQRWAVVVPVVLVATLALLPGSRVQVRALSVQTLNNYKDQLSVTGKIRPSEEYFLTLNRGGKVDRVLVQEGDSVQEGQLIAIVDEAVRTTGLKSALSAYRLAARDVSRVQSLLQQGASTPQELDEARARLDQKRSELEAAKTNLADGVIRSPVTGRLSVFVFRVGDQVPDGSRVGVVQRVDSFEAIAKFPFDRKTDLIGVRDVVLTLDERAQKARNLKREQATFRMKSEVLQLSKESDFDGQNVDLRIKIGALPVGLQAGDNVEISIVMREIPEVTTVSASSVKWRDRKPFLLFLNPDGALSWRAIQVGQEIEGRLPVWGVDTYAGFVDSEKTAADLDLLIKKKSKARIVEEK